MDENNGSDLAIGATETVVLVPEKEVSQAVQVAVHIRPLIIQERIQGCKECVSVTLGEPQIQLGAHCFTFDHVYGSTGSLPANIFEECAVPLVDGLFQGYNATVLAYGQTGSGKTYTMGTGGGDGGIIPQVMQRIFDKVDTLKYKTDFQIRVSFIEILKEEIQDLLDPNPVAAVKPEPFSAGVFSVRTVSPGKPPILIRETTNGGITLTGITETDVNTLEEMLSCLEQGSLSRATGSTNMNTHSSRSHAIFTITLEQRRKWDLVDASSEDLGEDFLCAKLHLVDLAGSERVKRTGADGMRFKEGVHINRGLLALGNVISALGDDKKRRDGGHVPYRDSKLTRLLQDSLGGNSRTVMIACISPADINAEETLNTLKYANRARNIQNKPMVNRDPAGAEIQKLRQQLELLQSELLCARASNPSTDEVQILKQKIVWLEASNEQLRRELLQCHEELDAFSHKALDIEADRDSLRAQLEGLGKPAAPDKNGETKGVEKLKDYLARIKGPEQELQTSGSDMTNHSSPTSYAGNGNISEAQPGCLDREPDSEEKVFEHNCLQDSLDKELRELNKQLAQKEAEMKTFVKSDSVVLKQHFERKLVELEEEKQELQKERDKLFTELETITSASDEQTQKMQHSYVEKLKDLEYQISDLKKKQDNQAQLLKQKQRSDEAAKRLQEEICRIKQQKVQLQIKIKQESEQFRTWKAAQEKQLLQLRKEGRRNEYEMHKLRALHQHQKMVLQRKTEEAAIATRRLKELLETKKGSSRDLTTTGGSVATSNFTQNDEKNLQLWLDHELEVAVHMYGLHAAYERQDDAYDRQHDIQDDGVRNREHEICSKEHRSYHYIEQNGNTRIFDCQSLLPSAPAKHSRMGFLEAMLNTSSETFSSMASQIAETEEDQVPIGHDRWQNVRTIGDSKLLLNLTFNIAAFSRYQLRERELENMELKEKLMDLSEAFRHSESRRGELERQHHLKDQAVAMALAAATKARADIAVKCGVEELSIGFSQLAAVGSTPPHFHYTENCSDYFSKSSGFPYSHKKVPLLDSENVGENGGGSQTGKLWKWKRGQQRWALQFKWKWQKPWRISEWGVGRGAAIYRFSIRRRYHGRLS